MNNVKIDVKFSFWGYYEMNRAAACIKLIQILSARTDYINTEELADLLETNPRNVREYIKELEVAGYTLESMKGLYGGYKLDKSCILPAVKLNGNDKKIIGDTISYLENCKDFLGYKDFLDVMGRIVASVERSNEVTPITMIDRFPLAMDKNELEARYQTLQECIDAQMKCEITYRSAKNKEKIHTIHPYKLFVYNGTWFVLAYNESINDFGYFKLNRLVDIFKTRNHFTILKTYDEKNYLDDFGMTKNGEYYKVTLEFTNLNMAISERIYGRHQVVTELDPSHTRFTAEMQNKDMIASFVMSFGKNCKVIEPEWLKEKVKKHYLEALKEYMEESNV